MAHKIISLSTPIKLNKLQSFTFCSNDEAVRQGSAFQLNWIRWTNFIFWIVASHLVAFTIRTCELSFLSLTRRKHSHSPPGRCVI